MLHVSPLGFLSFPTGGYVPAGAIWLDGSADYLSWTPSGAGDSTTEGIFSAWVKLSKVDYSSTPALLRAGSMAGTYNYIHMTTSERWAIEKFTNPSTTGMYRQSDGLYRDATAWAHICGSFSTSDATADDRFHLYVNGVREDGNSVTTPSSGEAIIFGSAVAHSIGLGNGYFDGYLADVVWLDGVSIQNGDYAITDFVGTDDNGNPIPVNPSVLTFGTNGFWLDFADSADLGNDVSGNGNDWTPISMSSANSTLDRPADKAADDLGNHATLNPLKTGGGTISLANTRIAWGATTNQTRLTIPPVEGTKIYLEIECDTIGDHAVFGVQGVNASITTRLSNQSGFYGFGHDNGTNWMRYDNGVATAVTGSFAGGPSAGDRMKMAFDFTDLTSVSIWIGLVGDTWIGDPAAGTGASITGLDCSGTDFATGGYTSTITFAINAVGWEDTVPTGFSALNTANLPAPTVTKPDDYFNTVLYTGTSATLSVTGLDFQPDFVWIKTRSTGTTSHQIYDAVRGATKYVKTNSTGEELTYADTLTSFDSGGFSLGADASSNDCNFSGRTYVAWCMKAGGAGLSNTNGSITSTVSVAAHGGFSIITYTGTGANATVGHGLSKAPTFIMVKARNQAYSWGGWHDGLTPGDYVIRFDSSAAESNQTGLAWQSTPPSSTVITLGSQAGQNGSGDTHVCYAFARTPGLIGIGSYVGNGSADGPYVVVDDGASGFRPAWLLVKRTDSADGWNLHDAARDPYNVSDTPLQPNDFSAEGTLAGFDFTANGFKLRTSNAGYNASGGTYIYLAFAEYPFGGEGVAQAKAR